MLYTLRQYTLPLALAVVLHGAAVWALYQGWNPEKERLNFVKPQTVMANLIVLQPKAQTAPPPRVEPAPAPNQAEARREAEQQAQAQREAERRAAEKRAADKRAAELREQENKQAEEAARERERQERLERLSELAATSLEQAIAEETADLNEGTEEMVVRSYHAAIYDLVRRNWSRPPSSRTGMQARLQVELIPTGEVVAVTVVESSGNAAFDRSAEHAVRRAKRFEVPQDNALFEKHFRRFYFLFQPEDLLR